MTGDVTSRQIVPKSPACPEGLFLMDGIEGLRSLPKHSVDMLLTDPPYGTTRNFWDLHVMVSEEEQALIQQRMAESGIRNMGAYMRKMALNGYVLHVDLSPVRELVSLQRRCSNNLNQVAIQANTYGGIYPEEIAALQRDYAALWGPLSDLLKKLSALVEL